MVKAHGHDNITAQMLKVFSDSICKPSEMIGKQALLIGVYLANGKNKYFLFHKNGSSKISKIIVQFLFFQLGVKFLKDLFLAKF